MYRHNLLQLFTTDVLEGTDGVLRLPQKGVSGAPLTGTRCPLIPFGESNSATISFYVDVRSLLTILLTIYNTEPYYDAITKRSGGRKN